MSFISLINQYNIERPVPNTKAVEHPQGSKMTKSVKMFKFGVGAGLTSFLDAMRLKINRMCSAFSMPKLRSGLILQVFRAVRG